MPGDMLSAPQSLLLASRSPRRRELLLQLGIEFEVIDVAIDESPRAGEAPADYVQRLAVEKAAAGRRQHPHDPRPVLGADTTVVVEGVMLGQPADRAEALTMLRQLSGREHQVHTGIALDTPGGVLQGLSTTRVWFRELDEASLARYWASGEPLGKAGAYAIQGRAAAFVTRIDGSYSGVVGLPLHELSLLLARLDPAAGAASQPAPL
jgi:septum formation protein